MQVINNYINNFKIIELDADSILTTPPNEIYLLELIEPSSFGLFPIPVEAIVDGKANPAWFSYGAYKRAVRIIQELDYVEPIKTHNVDYKILPIKENDAAWRGYVGESASHHIKNPRDISTAGRNRSGQFRTCAPHQKYRYPSLRG